MKQQESFWRDRARVKWSRDRCKKFLKRAKSRIHSLRVGNNVTDNPDLIADHIVEFYKNKNLYNAPSSTGMADLDFIFLCRNW